jgi:hypothetical protein
MWMTGQPSTDSHWRSKSLVLIGENSSMTTSNAPITAGEALTEIDHALDRIDPHRSDLAPQTRLEWVRLARKAQTRLEALTGLLTAEADQAQASIQATGTPLTSWLGMGENLSRREAAAAVYRARSLAEHPQIGQAATKGQIGTGQAQAISKVLTDLAPQLDRSQKMQAEQVMVGLAQHMDSQQLSQAAAQVLAQVAPADAAVSEQQRLQRATETAHRQRSLRFVHDGASVLFDGSLPQVEGETFIALIRAHGESLRRTAIEARDPLLTQTSVEQRRADALISLINTTQPSRPATGTGGAKVVVTLNYEKLHTDAADAGLIGDGQPLSAGELRRACCDADIVPVVLGTASEVLDVGRASRLATPAIRTALTQRDRGCVFPGCDVPASICEAHHIEPWWSGAPTALSNLVLLCHHHHGLAEPAKFTTRDQWQVCLGADQLPEFIPPARLDRTQQPIRHRRHGGTGQITTTEAAGTTPEQPLQSTAQILQKPPDSTSPPEHARKAQTAPPEQANDPQTPQPGHKSDHLTLPEHQR